MTTSLHRPGPREARLVLQPGVAGLRGGQHDDVAHQAALAQPDLPAGPQLVDARGERGQVRRHRLPYAHRASSRIFTQQYPSTNADKNTRKAVACMPAGASRAMRAGRARTAARARAASTADRLRRWLASVWGAGTHLGRQRRVRDEALADALARLEALPPAGRQRRGRRRVRVALQRHALVQVKHLRQPSSGAASQRRLLVAAQSLACSPQRAYGGRRSSK